jgi:hypothetical protein
MRSKIFFKILRSYDEFELEPDQTVISFLKRTGSLTGEYIVMIREDDDTAKHPKEGIECGIEDCNDAMYKRVILRNAFKEEVIIRMCRTHYNIYTHNEVHKND